MCVCIHGLHSVFIVHSPTSHVSFILRIFLKLLLFSTSSCLNLLHIRVVGKFTTSASLA